MDDRELETLFREAPGDTPAPTFDAGDIAARSKRATARKQNMIVLACSFGVLVLAGLGTLGVLLNGNLGEDTASVAGAPDANSATKFGAQEQPGDAQGRLPNAGPPEGFPDASPKQGGDASGESTPGCDQVDRELAIALAGELPVAVTSEAQPGRVCSPGWRSVAFQVNDGAASGTLSATVVPEGTAIELAEQPEGTVIVERTTPSNATLLVLSIPEQGPEAPFAGAVESIAAELAARY
ncbi:hypothetical protein SAMN05216266_101260 [Amycolatopsis marina]|uniref:Uncharacterized protein n=1 Tax=Amycolatopsis marina TaxID=490629 RepID=A0A1I0VI69_9PSEU|nr:hypothetical protein [Amycolatopsis marina]SFA75898.1 hypothetical protein SAMN05216266_101260 [Amycolatopsis marina]